MLPGVRTTLEIDDGVLAAARAIAASQRRSVGAVVSELARRGLEPAAMAEDDGFPVFAVPAGAPPITPEMVERALNEW